MGEMRPLPGLAETGTANLERTSQLRLFFFFSLFKEFLLKQEFYNPNYVSLLSYQFCYLKQK